MKCHYCSQECKPIESPDYMTLAKEECHGHRYLIRTFYKKAEPSIVHYTYYPMYKGKKYKVLLIIDNDKISCTISCAQSYAAPIQKDIVTFDFDPGITPENVLQKLPTILTFL